MSSVTADGDMTEARLRRLAFNISLDQDLLHTVTRYADANHITLEEDFTNGRKIEKAMEFLPPATLPDNVQVEIIEDTESAEKAVEALRGELLRQHRPPLRKHADGGLMVLQLPG